MKTSTFSRTAAQFFEAGQSRALRCLIFLAVLFLLRSLAVALPPAVNYSNASACDLLVSVMYGDATGCDPATEVWRCEDPCVQNYTISGSSSGQIQPVTNDPCEFEIDICRIEVWDPATNTYITDLHCNYETQDGDRTFYCGATPYTVAITNSGGVWWVRVF